MSVFSYFEAYASLTGVVLSLFFALIYCKQNPLVISLIYITAKTAAAVLYCYYVGADIFAAAVTSLISAAAAVVILVFALLVHYLFKRKIKSLHALLYGFAPLVLEMYLHRFDDTLLLVVSAVLYLISYFAWVTVLYLCFTKRFKFPAQNDEKYSLMLISALLGAAFCAFENKYFSVYYFFCALFSSLIAAKNTKSALLFAAFFGVGGLISSQSISVFALSFVIGASVSVLYGKAKNFSPLLTVGAFAAIGYFYLKDSFTLFTLIAPAAGAIFGAVLPKRLLVPFAVFFGDFNGTEAASNTGKEVSQKIRTLSAAFSAVAEVLRSEREQKRTENYSGALCAYTRERVCAYCPDFIRCEKAQMTERLIFPLCRVAAQNGNVSLIDVPREASTECGRIPNVISNINTGAERIVEEKRFNEELLVCENAVISETTAVADILSGLSSEILCTRDGCSTLSSRLTHELNSHSITVENIEADADNAGIKTLSLTTTENDVSRISDSVHAVSGTRTELIRNESLRAGKRRYTFARAQKFKISYAEKGVTKNGTSISGDTARAVRVKNDTVMLILSDGMGSGIEAGRNSQFAVNLIESLLKAGFNARDIINTVGYLLSLRGKEDFNAVDIC
ncbi:MAG: hypothetical protein LBN25_02420, partial [Christensenellaceae bacterium]|nr:hypothetical protein [Christensenellaceae bacterium]